MVKKRRGFTAVTQKEFDSIKKLQDMGFGKSETARLLNRAASTIGYIFTSDNLESYKTVRQEENNRLFKKNVEPVEEPQAASESDHRDELEHQATRIADSLDRLVNILERIGDS